MSKKKGLSFEEKRVKLNSVFFEKKDFLSLKEIEKFGCKEKGLSPMQIKEILQSLVDDNLVQCEKIGTSNYYWAFPSQAGQTRKRKLAEINGEIDKSQAKIANLEKQKKVMDSQAAKFEEIESVMCDIRSRESSINKLKSELEIYKDCDPEVINKLTEEVEIALESANRWTDNLFNSIKWCLNRNSSITESQLMQQLGVPADLDYVQ